MKMRTIPYGYIMQDGIIMPHTKESQVIQHIYHEYLKGESLLKIAQALAAKKIEFLPSRHDWNKNRIKRILEEPRYLGNDTYPRLIEEDMQRKAKAVKDSKNTQKNKSENPFRLPCLMECLCGTQMKHRHDKRRKKSTELWTCQNPDCKRIVNINDGTLLTELTKLLNLLIANPHLIQTNIVEPDPPMEVRRLQNEIYHHLDILNFEKDDVKSMIFSLASEKYRQTDNQNIISQMMRAELENQAPLSHFSINLLKKMVSKLLLDTDSNPILILKNGQNIGKEHGHANSNSIGG